MNTTPSPAAGPMTAPTAPRSNFVNVVAGLFLAISAFSCLISLGQNLMLHLLFPLEQMKAQLGELEQLKQLPRFFTTVFLHMEWFVGGFLVLSILQVLIAIGLLKRREWARLFFIAWMVLAAITSLGSVVGMFEMLRYFPIPTDAPQDFLAQFEAMMRTFKIMSVVMGVGTAVLFGWVAWRLTLPRYVDEFR